MIADVLVPLEPEAVTLTGWLGRRVVASEKNRLLEVDLEPLLAGFRQKPGSHPWIGEHIGKWLHAATLAWKNTGDSALKTKLDRAAADLVSCQEADGYLGTYTKETRFGLYKNADWDVWSHKYCLIGLLTYWQHTKNSAALRCCERIGDLLCATFGREPGKKSLNTAGTHVGMAATSVLEPMVLLARATKNQKYLDFCFSIVDGAWTEPGGARVLQTLTETGKVNKTANGKAYEMLSNLVGLCELYRETGQKRLLVGPVRAFDDIVENQRYLTGTMSHGEHFGPDHALPNTPRNNIGETCVTVTWLQLCWQLLRLTGEAKYADEIERAQLNHLAAAQRPDGAQWCYYTPLEGTKPYGPGINCCVSSGPRGMALAPQTACYVGDEGKSLVICSLDSFAATMTVNGVEVRVVQSSPLPASGPLRLSVRSKRPVKFDLLVRRPAWALWGGMPTSFVSTKPTDFVRSEVTGDDTRETTLELVTKTVDGTFTNAGKTAKTLGPFVLATQNGAEVLFADAGAKGEKFQIWTGGPKSDTEEDRSRTGNADGSITDGDPRSFVVTFDGKRATDDWYSLTFVQPKMVREVVFCHGHTFHDGGWFDASGGKPRLEGKRGASGAWEPLGVLTSYPATTATDARGLTDGQAFVLRLPQPLLLAAVRIVGKPAPGDNPRQAFSSCGELTVRGDSLVRLG